MKVKIELSQEEAGELLERMHASARNLVRETGILHMDKVRKLLNLHHRLSKAREEAREEAQKTAQTDPTNN